MGSNEHVRTDPASDAQRQFAASLGVELPLGATVEEASELIDLAPATDEQFRLIAEVGLELPSHSTYSEAKRLISVAYRKAGKRALAQLRVEVGDILLKDGLLWEVKNIFEGYRLSLKRVRPVKKGRKVTIEPTGEAGKVFNAFTFRSAIKIDPQTILLAE